MAEKHKEQHGITLHNIETRVIVRVLVISIVLFLMLRGIYLTRGVLVLIGTSFFLALALNAPVSFLARRMKGKRGFATGTAYLVVIGLMGLLLYFIVPPLVNETRTFIDKSPEYIESIKNSNSKLAQQARRYDIPAQLENAQRTVKNNLSKAGGPIFSLAKAIVSSVAALITVLVLTFFMLVEGPQWVKIVLGFQPVGKRKHHAELANKMYKVITGYVNGQLLIALLGAISVFIALSIVGMPYALPLAGIAFILNLIPLVGASLNSVLLFLVVALFKSPGVAVIVAIYLLIYQQIENSFIQPRIQAKVTNISPLTVLVSAIIGGTLAGLLGALVAIPVAACLRILVLDYLARNNNRIATAGN